MISAPSAAAGRRAVYGSWSAHRESSKSHQRLRSLTFLGIFHDQHHAEEYAARVEGAKVARVILRDAPILDVKALIG
jgi:hypothetical protein